MTDRTLAKFEIPTQQQIDEWSSLPHVTETLKRIKHPLLCGWTMTEVISELKGAIIGQCRRYGKGRRIDEDSEQNGVLGVLAAVQHDAGISPFFSHAWKHIRTAVRRPVVSGRVVRRADSGHSPTDALVTVTSFLQGNWLAHELDAAAHRRGYSCYRNVEQDQLHDLLAGHAPTFVKELRRNSRRRNAAWADGCNRQALIKLEELVQNDQELAARKAEAIRKAQTVSVEIEKEARIRAKEARTRFLNSMKGIGLLPPEEPVLAPSKLRTIPVQKIGNSRAQTTAVRQSLRLSELPPALRHDLIDVVDRLYGQLDLYDPVKTPTVGDLVRQACRRPSPEIKQISEEHVRHVVDDHEGRELQKLLPMVIDRARKLASLTAEQEIVLCWRYGLPLSGDEDRVRALAEIGPGRIIPGSPWTFRPEAQRASWIAEHFNRLGGDRPVSKQRIGQHLDRIRIKLLTAVYQALISGRPDFRSFAERIMVLAGLSPDEKTAVNLFNDILEGGGGRPDRKHLASGLIKVCSTCI